MLQGVVQYGTGKAAAIPGWQIAGKTGTTENYGDAWFVGYTPPAVSPDGKTHQLVAAVWVGYPNKLVPMLTEFHGHPVAGGTFPALIWKAFMTKAITFEHLTPQSFPYPQSQYAGPVRVVNRGGLLMRDNGVCKNSYQLEFYGGTGPNPVATCKPNEVEVPDVVGYKLVNAKSRLDGQPLTPTVIYRPAKPGERLGIVVKQWPRRGTASAYDKITLVLPKAEHGAIPKCVGPRGGARRCELGAPAALARRRAAGRHRQGRRRDRQSTGDGFFVAFDDARQGIDCAIAIQRALRDHRDDTGFAIPVRIGLHTADANRRGADYSGMGVHVTARVTALAGGGEIVATSDVIADAGDVATTGVREATVKGVSAPVQVASISWA